MIIARVEKIENGYILHSEGKKFYLDYFNVELLKRNNPETVLKDLVLSFPANGGKIPPIKAVREWCNENKFDKYLGLKEAKDFVESIRTWTYPPLR